MPLLLTKCTPRHGRPHIGANGVSWPPGKMDEKFKKRKHAKRAVFWMGVGRTALCWPHIYSDIVHNAPFRSQIFKISSPQAARGHWPPNQNPADALAPRYVLYNSPNTIRWDLLTLNCKSSCVATLQHLSSIHCSPDTDGLHNIRSSANNKTT